MRWWPLSSHSVAAMRGERPERAVIEPRAGGRMYEVMPDGSESPWGTVQTWEPPHRIVIAWHVNPTAPAPTEIEVTFTPEGAGTCVRVEHRGWERLGVERGQEARDEYAAQDGWPFVLGCYEAAAR